MQPTKEEKTIPATDGRPIPRWAAALIARWTRERPAVVTRRDLATDVPAGEVQRDRAIQKLQQLGWLMTLHLKGVWAFVPPGEAIPTDPYLDLRAWRARDPDAVFALAGESAAWHLGYLQRRFDGRPAMWVPRSVRIPHGLRPHVSLVRIDWPVHSQLGPSPRLLRKKGLDLTAWSSNLPALGPEALLVQLAARPTSFRAWADLVAQMDLVASDCDLDRLTDLLRDQSASAWQRAGYLLERGGRRDDGLDLLTRRPNEAMPVVVLGQGPSAEWSKDFQVNDHLVAPLQRKLGKA